MSAQRWSVVYMDERGWEMAGDPNGRWMEFTDYERDVAAAREAGARLMLNELTRVEFTTAADHAAQQRQYALGAALFDWPTDGSEPTLRKPVDGAPDLSGIDISLPVEQGYMVGGLITDENQRGNHFEPTKPVDGAG